MVLAADTIPAAPVLIFMGLGVVLAIVGHASKSRALVVAGITILFMATIAMVLGAYFAFEGGESDIRPKRNPEDPTF